MAEPIGQISPAATGGQIAVADCLMASRRKIVVTAVWSRYVFCPDDTTIMTFARGLPDLVDQPIEGGVELGRGLVSAGGDFGADAADHVLADAGRFGRLNGRFGGG